MKLHTYSTRSEYYLEFVCLNFNLNVSFYPLTCKCKENTIFTIEIHLIYAIYSFISPNFSHYSHLQGTNVITAAKHTNTVVI